MKREVLGDDSALVEACTNRDLKAWADFIAKYSRLIFISIESRLKKYNFSLPAQDIEDIKQNVLASIWQNNKLVTVRNRRDISYWLAIVSGNVAIEYIRKKRSLESPAMISLSSAIGEKEIEELIGGDSPLPRDEILKNELTQKIDEAIGSLPAKERLVIKLNLFHDKKYYEIAEVLNLPKGTVSSYIKRAKDRLREALKDFV